MLDVAPVDYLEGRMPFDDVSMVSAALMRLRLEEALLRGGGGCGICFGTGSIFAKE